jgi:hypothetical protein
VQQGNYEQRTGKTSSLSQFDLGSLYGMSVDLLARRNPHQVITRSSGRSGMPCEKPSETGNSCSIQKVLALKPME